MAAIALALTVTISLSAEAQIAATRALSLDPRYFSTHDNIDFKDVHLVLAEAFFFSEAVAGQFVPVLLLFMLLSGLLTFWLSPFTSLWSRKHEYEADAFARDAMDSAEPLLRALRKLHKENLSNLTPHPMYSRFYYSHPTLLEREGSLRNQ